MADVRAQTNCKALTAILDALPDSRPSGDGWSARCPAHDDREASLSVAAGTSREVVFRCFVGCEPGQIVRALGLDPREILGARVNGTVSYGASRDRGPARETVTVSALATAKGLPEAYLRRLGLRDAKGVVEIPYLDTDGRELFARRRLTVTGKNKTLRPKGVRLQPYGLERLAGWTRRKALLLVEGESDAWAGWHHGVAVVGLPGADTAAALRLGHVEAFDKVYMITEPDKGGQTFGPRVKQHLDALGWDGKAFAVELYYEGCRIKDLADLYLAVGGDRKAFSDALATAYSNAVLLAPAGPEPPVVTFEPPRPLFRPLPDPEPFPTDALGPVLKPAAQAIARVVRAAPAICGQSTLAVAALAVQAHVDILLPFGQRRPTSSYFVTVSDSGERKTSVDTEALHGVRAVEETLLRSFPTERASYADQQALWESERRRVLGSNKLTVEEKQQELEILGEAPTVPLDPMLTCPEPTFEGLVALFQTGRPSLGLFSSEGGQFLGGFALPDEHWLKTCAALSTLWDGEPIRRVRRGDGSLILAGRGLALHLLVQPNVATRLLANAEIAGQGLLARLLVAAPLPLAGSRQGRIEKVNDRTAISAFGAVIQELLKRTAALRSDGGLAPGVLRLNDKAAGRWQDFSDHVEGQLGEGGELHPVKAFGSKMAEHAARLGGILQTFEDTGATSLTVKSLDRGIELTEWYASEWQRLHESQAINEALLAAEKLRQWLLNEWELDMIGLPDVYQRGPNSLRDAATARACMRTLAEHGWVIPLIDGAEIEGNHRREAWEIVREG